jgi:FAD dependent oxidoreductase
VLIGGGHRGRALRDENVTVLDWAKLGISARTVHDVFPIMRSAHIIRARAGIEARMPDEIPVFGPSGTSEGVFHQFGFSAHGFQLGPGAGYEPIGIDALVIEGWQEKCRKGARLTGRAQEVEAIAAAIPKKPATMADQAFAVDRKIPLSGVATVACPIAT